MNGTAEIPSFAQGTRDPVTIKVTQSSPGASTVVALLARDTMGNTGELLVTITAGGATKAAC